MMALFLTALLALPLLIAALARAGLAAPRLRAAALVAAILSLAGGLAALFLTPLDTLRVPWPTGAPAALGDALFTVTALSAPLVPLPAGLWLTTVAATPAARLDRLGLGRTALATVTVTGAFMTRSPVLLALAWVATTTLFLRGLSPETHRAVRRNAGLYLWSSVVAFVGGVALTQLAPGPKTSAAGIVLIGVAVLIRKGIFPFHAWIPNAFDQGRIGPTVLFSAPQLGTYAAAVLVVPHADAGLLRVAAILSLVTAVYGAVLALVQRDARRATGYIFVSQSALVFAGLDCTSPEALAGALILWLSSALAFTGMARALLALEARRGRLDLTTHHGGYEQMPLLATAFLVLALACTGFPGTLGFVGEEMLLEGAVHDFPVLGLMVVVTSAFIGLAVLRMYFSLFCGQRSAQVHLRIRRREAVIFGGLAAVLLATGLFPGPLASSRYAAAAAVVAERHATTGATHPAR
jgi:NADH-quinone oxidoreductase subunit M